MMKPDLMNRFFETISPEYTEGQRAGARSVQLGDRLDDVIAAMEETIEGMRVEIDRLRGIRDDLYWIQKPQRRTPFLSAIMKLGPPSELLEYGSWLDGLYRRIPDRPKQAFKRAYRLERENRSRLEPRAVSQRYQYSPEMMSAIERMMPFAKIALDQRERI